MRIPRPVVGYSGSSPLDFGAMVIGRRAPLPPHAHHGAVSVPHHGVRNTAHQRPPYPAVVATAHNDQPRSQLLGQAHDLLGYPSHPEVAPANGPPGDLYPPEQLPEHLSALLLVLVVEQAVVTYGAGSIQEVGHPLDVNYVRLGSSALGEIYGCPGGQLGLLGAVGGQQDLRMEDLHFERLLAAIRPTVMIPLAPQRHASYQRGGTQKAGAL